MLAARKEAAVPDCAYGEEICTACGACDYEVVDTIVYHPEDYRRQPPREPEEKTGLKQTDRLG